MPGKAQERSRRPGAPGSLLPRVLLVLLVPLRALAAVPASAVPADAVADTSHHRLVAYDES